MAGKTYAILGGGGNSNCLKRVQLVAAYIIVATMSYFPPSCIRDSKAASPSGSEPHAIVAKRCDASVDFTNEISAAQRRLIVISALVRSLG